MDNQLRIGFGSKEKIATAVERGLIAENSLLLLSNGEFGWQNKDNETVIHTPRTQGDLELSDGTVIDAGTTLEEILGVLAQMEHATEITEF